MRILITGYKGYIGGHLYQSLLSRGYEVVGVDLKDGEDITYCLPNEDFDYVFHLAALPRVEYSVENPSYTLRQNVYVTSKLLEWSKNHNVKRFIFSSSSAADGDGDGIPKSPYGLHKLMSEQECRLYSDLYNIDTVCLRYFNAYSKDQEFGGAYSTVVSAWMEMLKQGKPLRVDGTGEQKRDFVHVSDIVSANVFCMLHEEQFHGRVFDVGTGQSVTINYIKKYVSDKNPNAEWVQAPSRKGDAKETLADVEPLAKLGWVAKIRIKEGLETCF